MSVMKAFITKDENFKLTWLSLMHPGEATFEEYLHVHQDFHDRTTYDHLWRNGRKNRVVISSCFIYFVLNDVVNLSYVVNFLDYNGYKLCCLFGRTLFKFISLQRHWL
jgi:hypothetical protein